MRFQHWPTLLAQAIETKRAQPFAWGVNDCCLFASDIILALTGCDPASDIRGKYETALGAARLLDEAGGLLQLVEKKCAEFNWSVIEPSYAQRGDLLVADLETGETCGICIGSAIAFAGQDGVLTRPIQSASRAWRIN